MKMDLIANFIDKNNLELDNKVDATELVDNLTIDLDLISLDELDVIDGDFSSVYPEYHEKWEKLYWMIKSTLLVKIVEENKDSEEKNEEEEEEEEEEGDEDEDGIENLNNFKRSLRLIEQELTIFPFLRETSKKTISRHPRLKKVVTKAKNAKSIFIASLCKPHELSEPPVNRGAAQLFFDPQQAVVLCYPIRTTQGASLDLTRCGGDGQIRDRRIFRLAGAMGNNHPVVRCLGHVDRSQGFR